MLLAMAERHLNSAKGLHRISGSARSVPDYAHAPRPDRLPAFVIVLRGRPMPIPNPSGFVAALPNSADPSQLCLQPVMTPSGVEVRARRKAVCDRFERLHLLLNN
jgi:hypothetical protein